ncbi:hypothetical protein [Simiduia litorea]
MTKPRKDRKTLVQVDGTSAQRRINRAKRANKYGAIAPALAPI